MRSLLSSLICLGLVWPAAHATPTARWTTAEPPRLVVMLVIDQFRADYLSRFRDQLGPDGLRRFAEQGAYFPQGEYQMMQCMTGPGHSVILSGAWPAQTGIPINSWFDRTQDRKVYCVEDRQTAPVNGPEWAAASARNFWAPTLGDALKNAGLPSKVVGLAHKDRAAILLAGHRADEVVWLDRKAIRWMSSKAYRPDGTLPAWVEAQNRALAKLDGGPYVWSAKGPGSGLSEEAPKGFRARWVHGEDPEVIESPFGFQLLTDAALAATTAHQLGADATPDVLAVSYSVFDMVGHEYGANHRRMEALLLAADRSIARLMTALEAKVGVGKVVFALTGDHGVGPAPAYARARGLPAGRVDQEAWVKALDAHLRAALGPCPKGDWVRHFSKLNLYLHPHPRAQAEAAAWLRQQPETLWAVTAEDIARGNLPPEPIRSRILNQYVPARSGDVVVLVRPFHIAGKDTASHLTGHAYDRMVPIAFVGAGIKPGVHPGGEVVDIAPTLAWLTGVLPPALSVGRVLREALAD